ncbi:AHH domain-containing protein [Corallococcus aberystwythensis]|nr:AHH domain-containing protein [Corallococcus aberystwythensis]
MTDTFGFIDHRDGANIRTLPAELTGSMCLTRMPLPSGTRVTFIRNPARVQQQGWAYVGTEVQGHLLRGYVQALRITTRLPEPAATLYEVRSGDRLEPIAARIYKKAIKPGRDLRFYENVIEHVNAQSGRDGVIRHSDGDVRLVAGKRIWLVSVEFANRLQEIVPSGSISREAIAKARKVARHLEDVITSVETSWNYIPEVAGEYAGALWEHRNEIIGIVLVFIGAEALSLLLALSPTGVGQLAAAVIQLGLAAFGAKGVIDAGVESLKHAQAWLTQAWQANGSKEKLKEASKSFVRMLTSIAMAALAVLGMKANMNRGLKLAQGVKITPPGVYGLAAQGPGGHVLDLVVFRPGSITRTSAIPGPWLPGGTVAPLMAKAAKLVPDSKPSPAKAASSQKPPPQRMLSDAALEKLLEKLPNWDRLKELVGRIIPDEGTPEFNAFKKELEAAGYRLEKLSQGPQPYRLRRPNGKALGKEHGALTVTEGRMVVLKAKGTSRISVHSRYRKKYLDWLGEKYGPKAKAAAESRLARGYQLHHLIPDAIAQKHPLLRMALKRVEGFTIDRGTNILDMPLAKTAPMKNMQKFMHMNSHSNYSKHVIMKLDHALSKLGPGSKLTPEAIDKAILEVEDSLRKAIQSRSLPREVLKEVYKDGVFMGMTIAMLEAPSHDESLMA